MQNTQEFELQIAIIDVVRQMSDCAYLEKEAAAGTAPSQRNYYAVIDQIPGRFNLYVSARSAWDHERCLQQVEEDSITT